MDVNWGQCGSRKRVEGDYLVQTPLPNSRLLPHQQLDKFLPSYFLALFVVSSFWGTFFGRFWWRRISFDSFASFEFTWAMFFSGGVENSVRHFDISKTHPSSNCLTRGVQPSVHQTLADRESLGPIYAPLETKERESRTYELYTAGF